MKTADLIPLSSSPEPTTYCISILALDFYKHKLSSRVLSVLTSTEAVHRSVCSLHIPRIRSENLKNLL
jgi:hypothetical protein